MREDAKRTALEARPDPERFGLRRVPSRRFPGLARLVQGTALASALALGLASDARAAVFLVTNTADSGGGSLRQAVLDANASAGPDVVAFAGAGASGVIALTTGEIAILEDLTILAPQQWR